MNILLLGSGGREHALAWKIAASPLCTQLYIAPGNPGTSALGTNVAMEVNDFAAIADFCRREKINMLVVGPEDPLVHGIVDFCHRELPDVAVIGPQAIGAQLEGSKDFAKQFLLRHRIPTASYQTFDGTQLEAGIAYLQQHSMPVVLKADGLAAGKGVLICQDVAEATAAFSDMLGGKFGTAGSKVVVEQFLKGTELTVIILTDGRSWKILPPSKDYKRIGEGDTGLNTGGMGAVSPPPMATPAFMERVEKEIIAPTMQGLQQEQIPYKGFLYFGLIEVEGAPYVIEYNCRMGDPETQVILPRISSDLVELFQATAAGTLQEIPMETDTRAAATVILASKGYPEAYEKGKEITGLQYVEDGIVFHAGTRLDDAGTLRTNGGRVLAVTAYGHQLSDALRGSYANTARIYFENRYFRRDIGWDVL
ncbi:MAG: phosphoribosylamine--glycine ligase [Sphingobacteriales bacterium BACL12 MAG-120813-bin55]|jgi:phosphoribosylamine---glycine ligase|nr:MAG: phosphoribosylamine--glycine ligase [Sphingobacteriales bacterium BACL12 MAG-120802-bin5]KRP10697.1 MAG: phosphoribosylamine--glycine ligase [Sphingobacteriales bacterium BACL12 MAG-120813-bin55]